MENRTLKTAFLILIISTIFSYVYLGVCTRVSLASNVENNLLDNNINTYNDNIIRIEYSELNNYLS